ncbi:molybdopterin molybdotransferase MoeA [Chelatococcus asaccharovorans]|uniref:molybdopterin molybdotransferase MoeA n=1 Tax=Chelatococcus asaccharovorans TaxID=28210 RepID=UPI00224C6C27|nr:Molybdopterin molybdenumtransferase [Chelatococcus asaccharovorans]CAH1677768.1 Molybdopterin molybdenumtransferase [Chelatococcus asaccharovorans]
MSGEAKKPAGAGLTSVEDALATIVGMAGPALAAESLPLARCRGRYLAQDLAALRTQPPFDASAMDGYAVRDRDVTALPATLRVIGTSAAGHRFAGPLGAGEAVRIFTGAPVPEGADRVIIQEDTSRDGQDVVVTARSSSSTNIRAAGLDFTDGQRLIPAGSRLDARLLALAAAMGHGALPVHRRPRVAILATGDELVRPGEPMGPDQIVTSNSYAVAAMAEDEGAAVIDLGIAGDSFAALEAAINAARLAEADVLVTLGGASVGDHDLVQSALTAQGMELGFWRIAMRPGKPLMHGRLGAMAILGLPGNPVSAIVCALLFLVPLLRHFGGDPAALKERSEEAELAADVPANDFRQDYLRAELIDRPDGVPLVRPFGRQDSSMLSTLAASGALVLRPPHAPAAKAGALCRIMRLC